MRTPLRADQRVELVHDNAFHGAQQAPAADAPEQHEKRFRRGRQNLGRTVALPGALDRRRIAASKRNLHRPTTQPPGVIEQWLEIDGHVPRQRLQRRNVQGPHAPGRGVFANQRSTSGRQAARLLPWPVEATSSACSPSRSRGQAARWMGVGRPTVVSNQQSKSQVELNKAIGGRMRAHILKT